ncbi:MAG: hypothetical protein C0609_07600, partial [Deltaproteobacteria bacterium]
ETAIASLLPLSPDATKAARLWRTGEVRIVEAALLLLIWIRRGRSFADLGLRGEGLIRGVKVGALISAVMGLLVLSAELYMRLFEEASLFKLLTPKLIAPLSPLIIVGIFIGPIFEELLFRGFLYNGLRERYSTFPALLATTLLFGLLHFTGTGIPLIQLAGGAIFCLAFERSSSIAAPIIVHCLGNAAISLSPLVIK